MSLVIFYPDFVSVTEPEEEPEQHGDDSVIVPVTAAPSEPEKTPV